MPLLTDEEVKVVLKEGGMAIPEDKVVYADKTQREQLGDLYKKNPVKFEELMKHHGFEKKLTKKDAGILIADLLCKEAKND